jgi:hypothetical protein
MNRTNLLIQMAQLPATLRVTPDQLASEMVRRMQIVSPSGTYSIFGGDVEPSSNMGPWLKDGDKWYVWDDAVKRYVPQNLTDSETTWFHIGNSTPTTSTPPVWLRTTADYSVNAPTYGQPLSWYLWNGTLWVTCNGLVNSGPSSSRPPSPVELQQYYDTTISCLIWWERSMWRTVSGVPGDVKAVVHETLTDAYLYNPGWQVLVNAQQSWRGRGLVQAAKDSVASGGPTVLAVDADVAQRAAHEVYGTTDFVAIDPLSPVPYPPSLSLFHLVKL